MRVASAAIGWLDGERRRRNGWRGLAASAAVALASWALMVPLDAPWLFGVSLLAGLTGIASVVAIGSASHLRTWRLPGTLAIDDGAIAVSTAAGASRTALGDVVDGWIEYPSDVRLRTRDGRTLAVVAPDPSSAEALLAAAGVSATQRVLSVPLSSAASQAEWGVATSVSALVLLAPLTLFLVTVVSVGLGDLLRAPDAAGIVATIFFLGLFGAFAVAISVLIGSLLRRQAVVGVDGVTLEQGRKKTFVPYARIARVDADSRGVRVQRQDGSFVLLPTWQRGEPPLAPAGAPGAPHASDAAIRQHVLLERIARAARASRRGSADLAILDRRGRTLSEWRRDVQALARARADYRSVALTAADLADVVEDVAAPPERRIAAAMGLGASEDAAAQQRVRVVLDTCADEELKNALEQAGEAEADEEPIERVLVRR